MKKMDANIDSHLSPSCKAT